MCPIKSRHSSLALGLALGVLSTVVTLPASAELFVDKQFTVNVTSDIQYGVGALQSGSLNLFLDLYEPTGLGVPALKPAIVFVHGGGWAAGDKAQDTWDDGGPPNPDGDDAAVYAMEFAKRGYVCVSINYRMYGDNPAGTGLLNGNNSTLTSLIIALFPGQNAAQIVRTVEAAVQDTGSAIDWMATNAATYGVDPDRIAVGGYSAGAFNSLYAAYGASAPVAAVWAKSGGMAGYETLINSSAQPPAIIFHGSSDTIIPVSLAQAVNTRMNTIGLAHEYQELAGQDHYYFIDEPVSASTMDDLIAAFMLDHLRLGDSDNDTVSDILDAFPSDASETTDADDDGLGDNFEQAIIDFNLGDGISTLADVLQGADFDGDGYSNALEFAAGSDPTDAGDLPSLPVNGYSLAAMMLILLVSGLFATLDYRSRIRMRA